MKLTEGIHAITQSEGGRVHAFLLDTPGGVTLIDTLYDHDSYKLILDELATMGPDKRIVHICHTHSHTSHRGSTAVLQRKTSAVVYAHLDEAGIIAGYEDPIRVSWKPTKPFNWEVYKLQLGLALGAGKREPCEVHNYLFDGARIGNTGLETIHVPGHTPGCVAFWWPEKKALFAGDTISTWPYLEPGWKGLTFDNDENRRSIRKFEDLGAELLCVGHGEPWRGDVKGLIRRLAA